MRIQIKNYLSTTLFVFLMFTVGTVQAADSVQVNLNGVIKTLLLEENNQLSQFGNQKSTAKHYKGTVKDEPESWVRISAFSSGQWSGLVAMNGQMHSVEGKFADNRFSSNVAALRMSPMKNDNEMFKCGVSEHKYKHVPHSALGAMKTEKAVSCNSVDGICQYANIELILDDQYQRAFFPSEVMDSVRSLVNMVDGYYRNQFATELHVKNLVLLDSFNDPFSSSTDSSDLLTSIYSRRCEKINGTDVCSRSRPNYDNNVSARPASFFKESNSLVHLVTGRKFVNGVAGLAFSGDTISCSEFAVGTTNLMKLNGKPYLPATAVVMAHEIGHNLNSPHDDGKASCPADSRFIMKPSVNVNDLPTAFSSCSENLIGNRLAQTRTQSCHTAPVKLATVSNPLPANLTGSTLTLNDVISPFVERTGYRSSGNLNFSLDVKGTNFNAVNVTGSPCALSNAGTSATCQFSVSALGTKSTQITLNTASLLNATQSLTLEATINSGNTGFRNTRPDANSVQMKLLVAGNKLQYVQANSALRINAQGATFSGSSSLPDGSVIQVLSLLEGKELLCLASVSGGKWFCSSLKTFTPGNVFFKAQFRDNPDAIYSANVDLDTSNIINKPVSPPSGGGGGGGSIGGAMLLALLGLNLFRRRKVQL